MSYLSELREIVGSRLLLVPSVAAVVHNEEGHVLLGRKSEDGSWSLPAGAIEPGESPEQALRREVLEETGLDVVQAHFLNVVGGKLYRHTYPNGDQVEYTICVFSCLTQGLERPLDREFIELRWLAPADALALLSLPYPIDLLKKSQNKSR